jgi:hypothetical protein
VRHPPLFTVEQSRALRGSIPAAYPKPVPARTRRTASSSWLPLEDAGIELKSCTGSSAHRAASRSDPPI